MSAVMVLQDLHFQTIHQQTSLHVKAVRIVFTYIHLPSTESRHIWFEISNWVVALSIFSFEPPLPLGRHCETYKEGPWGPCSKEKLQFFFWMVTQPHICKFKLGHSPKLTYQLVQLLHNWISLGRSWKWPLSNALGGEYHSSQWSEEMAT